MKIPFRRVLRVKEIRSDEQLWEFFGKSTVNCKVDWNLFELIFDLKIVLITRRLENYFTDLGVRFG